LCTPFSIKTDIFIYLKPCFSIIKSKILYTLPYYIENKGGVRLENLQSTVDRIKAKQEAFRELKINNLLREKTPEDFERYINALSKEEKCKYMTGISEIINLCNNHFNCKFKGEIYKSFTSMPKKECLRERAIRFERILAE